MNSRLLKRSVFSPARPWRARTRLSPIFVLAVCSATSRWNPGGMKPEGVSPFAKNHRKGKRIARSAVCTSSPRRLPRPRWAAFLNSLREMLAEAATAWSSHLYRAEIAFQQSDNPEMTP